MATAFKKMQQKFVEVDSSNSDDDESHPEASVHASQSENEEEKEKVEEVNAVDSVSTFFESHLLF